MYIEKVKLSPDGSQCIVFFYSDKGEERFKELLPRLILYKPSIRTALAKMMNSKYVPQLVFKFASGVEQQRRVDDLIEALKKEGKL